MNCFCITIFQRKHNTGIYICIAASRSNRRNFKPAIVKWNILYLCICRPVNLCSIWMNLLTSILCTSKIWNETICHFYVLKRIYSIIITATNLTFAEFCIASIKIFNSTVVECIRNTCAFVSYRYHRKFTIIKNKIYIFLYFISLIQN